jgi:hypothetical protein
MLRNPQVRHRANKPRRLPFSWRKQIQSQTKKDSVQNVQYFITAILQAMFNFHFSDACHTHRPYRPTWLKREYHALLHYTILSTLVSFPLTSQRSRFSVLRHNAFRLCCDSPSLTPILNNWQNYNSHLINNHQSKFQYIAKHLYIPLKCKFCFSCKQ